MQTYRAPIGRWLLWCNKQNINPKSPQGRDLARFLANLFLTERLAYNTILLHKSAIATFCAGRSTVSLSADFLVHRVLKAISVARPQEVRSQIWDAQILLDWLSTRTDNLSFFEVSGRTAVLLLLASGRRVHDLTLLKILRDFLVNLEDEIILPQFSDQRRIELHSDSRVGNFRDTQISGCDQSHGSEQC